MRLPGLALVALATLPLACNRPGAPGTAGTPIAGETQASISGTLLDAATGEPLAGVEVDFQ